MTANEELIELLRGYITANKRQQIETVLAERTRHITVMLEDVYQPHNASACLRSCECLGVQDVYIVESEHTYEPNNEVSMGSSKWLSLNHYHKTSHCLETLKTRGYTLVATSPAEDGHDLGSLPIDRPIALLFGTEKRGLSRDAFESAETTLRLPMYGFTQSYNISVTLAIALSRLTERLRESDVDWQLSEKEKKELTLTFYRRIVRRHDLIESEFWDSRDD